MSNIVLQSDGSAKIRMSLEGSKKWKGEAVAMRASFRCKFLAKLAVSVNRYVTTILLTRGEREFPERYCREIRYQFTRTLMSSAACQPHNSGA